jgi:hypothetical protein
MMRPSRFNSLTGKRARFALVLTLLSAAVCADRDAAVPTLAPTNRASLDVNPGALASISITPNPVESGDTVSGTITLAAPAPAGGVHVIVKPFDPLYVSIDSNQVVPEGATSKTFTVITYASPFVEYSTRVDADWGASHVTTNLALKQVRWWRQLPIIKIAPNVAQFGSQAIGTTSAPQALTVSNIGTSTLTLGVISTVGPFTQTNTCLSTLAPGASCTVSVRYVPTAAAMQYGQLLVPGNSQGVPPLVAFSGSGFVAVPSFSLTPASMSFGTVRLDNASSAKALTITSTGNVPLVVSSLTFGGANPGDFYLSANGCTGVSLNPGASCTAYVVFAPVAIGARSATLTIASNASGGSVGVPVSGTGSTGSKLPPGGWTP